MRALISAEEWNAIDTETGIGTNSGPEKIEFDTMSFSTYKSRMVNIPEFLKIGDLVLFRPAPYSDEAQLISKTTLGILMIGISDTNRWRDQVITNLDRIYIEQYMERPIMEVWRNNRPTSYFPQELFEI